MLKSIHKKTHVSKSKAAKDLKGHKRHGVGILSQNSIAPKALHTPLIEFENIQISTTKIGGKVISFSFDILSKDFLRKNRNTAYKYISFD